ncbi:MAG: DUF4062 domain-containing protein [Marmoricola sp.]
MALILDRSGTAPTPDREALALWAGDQRIFISSVMGGDFTDLRRGLAEAVEGIGATPVWFEDFGGRDDDAQVAYLGEVATSTIYLGILGQRYGALDKNTRLSATHAEYREAERLGKRVSVWAGDIERLQADQYDFLREVRTFHTTGGFEGSEELVQRVRRRLSEMAGESRSPWVKLGDVVLRAKAVIDNGVTVVVRTSVHSPEVAAALEEMRPEVFRTGDHRLTWSGRSVPVRVMSVEVTTTSALSSAIEIVTERLGPRCTGHSSAFGGSLTTNGHTYSAEDLAVLDVRHRLFGDELPGGVYGFGTGSDHLLELPPADLPTALYQAVFSLLVTETLVKSGRAQRVDTAQVSPLTPEGRRVRLAWTGTAGMGQAPASMTVEGTLSRM